MPAHVNERLRNQTRPVWDVSVEVAANSETFTNVSATLGSPLTVPEGCSGVSICVRNGADAGDLFLYPLGGMVGICTTNNGGTVLTDATVNFTTAGVTVGDRVRNLTDGSVAVITVVGTTTVTHGALAGGDNDDWERIIDSYRIERIAEPRLVIRGNISSDKRLEFYMPLDSSWPGVNKAPFLLSANGTQDAVAFYHFD